MKIINIRFRKLRVGSFNAQRGSVSLEIFFNDGMEKQITRTTIIDDPQALAHSIVDEIKDMEKNIHYEFDDNSALQSYVSVLIQNEDIAIENIVRFLSQVSHRVKIILSSKLAEGYLDRIKELNRMSIDI